MQFELESKGDLIKSINAHDAWHYRIIPFAKINQKISCYTDSESNSSIEELELIYNFNFEFVACSKEELTSLLHNYYPKDHKDSRVNNLSYTGNADSFLNTLILEAKLLGSSDIHLETYEDKCRVRIRIDGLMIERYYLDKLEYPTIVNKIKIQANLDISEKRLPQDGRIFFVEQQKQFDIRVSVLPTLHGEKIVLRLLSNDANEIELNKLGFSERDLKNYLDGVKRPHGIILISGPTGSGKTTTLYATLKLLNKTTRNILTIEDPIEYTLEGINQVQLKENIGFTFASALRTFLRQDPDVIMVGEIRDAETANMAIRAALTGHLVLSTIHTNSAWGTVSRLIDMGLPPFLLSATLNTSVAQRLVRLLCPHCKEQREFTNDLYPPHFSAPKLLTHHYISCGCDKCYGTGYKGRKAVYEVIPIDFELSQSIKNNEYNISDKLKQRDINTISNNAFQLLANGLSAIDEIYPLLLQH
ncbi:MAG: GspE/PulE family protein [Sphingobacteriales bacterium]|nr:GspE/PulE family protein [Sphingobacteriales bacterium]